MKHASIVWFEIPVIDIDRAIRFYSEVLQISIKKQKLYKTVYGLMSRSNTAINGCLVVRPELVGKGTKIFFYVNVLSDAISIARSMGGELIIPRTLLKQLDENGNTLLAENMIDNQIGYYAELLDSEGNPLCLYSHH